MSVLPFGIGFPGKGLTLALGGLALALPALADEALVSELKADMLAEIAADARATRGYTGRDTLSPAVMAAMAAVPRHAFVEDFGERLAYANRPLPIGSGQTISQPFIVALMTDLLAPAAEHRVLEIGTGSGYQAAVLAELVAEVHTIEIIPALARESAERLTRLGYDQVRVRTGDGWHGWREAAPFDGIIVTAVGPEIPPALVEQLKPGGRLVLPVGPVHGAQNLTVVTRLAEGGMETRQVLPVAFVPLTRTP